MDTLDGLSLKMKQMLKELKRDRDSCRKSLKPTYVGKQVTWRGLLSRGLITETKIASSIEGKPWQIQGKLTDLGLLMVNRLTLND